MNGQLFEYQLAKISDIPEILILQEKFHVSNLSDEAKKNGFVTTRFTTDQVTEIINQEGLFISKFDSKIIAYVFAGSWQYFSQWEIFNVMVSRFPQLSFGNFAITDTSCFQYGPICIDENYRGKGLINDIFEFMRVNMLKKYPLALTFINKINTRSYHVHVNKLNWRVIDEFEFNQNSYFILAYDMEKSLVKK